jgi:hypothetical protein
MPAGGPSAAAAAAFSFQFAVAATVMKPIVEIAAMLHGKTAPREAGRAVVPPPAGVPQRWQNFAPAVSGVAQVTQLSSATGVPHSAQKRPATVAPHFVQT